MHLRSCLYQPFSQKVASRRQRNVRESGIVFRTIVSKYTSRDFVSLILTSYGKLRIFYRSIYEPLWEMNERGRSRLLLPFRCARSWIRYPTGGIVPLSFSLSLSVRFAREMCARGLQTAGNRWNYSRRITLYIYMYKIPSQNTAIFVALISRSRSKDIYISGKTLYTSIRILIKNKKKETFDRHGETCRNERNPFA